MTRTTGDNFFLFDAEPEITLRDATDAHETATGTETPISLKASGDNVWDDHSQTFIWSEVAVHVDHFDTGPFVISAEVSVDEAFTTPITVGEVTVTAAGAYAIVLHGPTIERVAPLVKYIRVATAVTAGEIGYSAWLHPVQARHS